MATRTVCDKCEELLKTENVQKAYLRGYGTWSLCLPCSSKLIDFIEARNDKG